MSTIAVGPYKRVTFVKQGAQGAAAAGGAAIGKNARRVTCTLDKKKAQYRSAEQNTSMQRKDSRHGVVSVDGTLSGELSAGAYQSFFESVCRQLVVAAPTSGPLATVAAVSSGAGTYAGTFTRSAGSFIADGFRVGHVMRWSGWATTGVPNNAHNLLITALTPTVMTVLSLHKIDIGAKVAGDNVTATLAGKVTYVPQTGHTRDYYTFEHFHADLVKSEVFRDVVIGGFSVKMGNTGMIGIDFPLMGLDMIPGNAAYFTSPAAAANGGLMASANGAVIVNGIKAGVITSAEFTATGNYSVPGGVVGDNIDPDVFPGIVEASGSVTVLFDSVTMRDYFLNETECTLAFAFTTGNLPSSDVVAFVIPSAKFGGADKDDGEKGISLTMPFIASERTDGAANLYPTTFSVQDSLFV